MQPSVREDYLEAIQNFIEKYAHPPHCKSLRQHLVNQNPLCVLIWKALYPADDISLSPGELISLTGQGQLTGKRVIKKHETLQCFLSEILGMDSRSASDEACTLEHAVSDETIDRLGQLIDKTEGHGYPGEAHGAGKPLNQCRTGVADCQYPFISDCSEGESVIIHCIQGKACSKRLLDLGMVPGEQVSIKRKLFNGALVVQVKGCDVALSPEIASAIGVERCA